MRREPMPMRCQVTIGSNTQAIKAQRVLSAAAIRTEVVKTENPNSRRGCSYALAYDCLQENNLYAVLQHAGIRIRK